MTRFIILLILVVGVGACLLLRCSASVPRIPARGIVGGQHIETTVDAESARYYLEQYLPHQRTNARFDTVFDQIHKNANGGIPDREYLLHLSEAFSVDLASLYLANRILADRANQSVEAQYQHELRAVRSESETGFAATGRFDPAYLILFVPGWDYIDSGEKTGADFARPRQIVSEMGIENYLVEIAPNGSIEHNAQLVADEVNRHLHSDRKILLVSASSGGPTTALAIGRLLTPRQTGSVKAWVNIGGILQGSPVADHYLSRPRSWLARVILFIKGWGFDSINSMSVKEGRSRYKSLRLPEDLLIVNYVGIPLSGDISKRAEKTYPILRKFGPNDGLTLITDELAPNSKTIVDVGRDHYFGEDPEIDLKTIAVTRMVVNALESKTSGCQ